MLHQFDKPTKIIFEYISNHPRSAREMICCLDNYSNDKKRKVQYLEKNAFRDYAYTCLDYLLELGLIFAVQIENHTYYTVTAKGNAYKRYKVLNFIKEYSPHIISVLSLIIAIIMAVRS